jgi:four helix bundle protein
MDKWMGGLRGSSRTFAFMEYTKRRNLNRGYMKLDAWQRGMDLFVMAFRLTARVSDLKLRSQFRDAAQSVSANIGEGYGRRSLPEYLQFLYIAKGSLAETLTRAIGFRSVETFSPGDFEEIDKLHYEVENKLLRLIESLESKRQKNDWRDTLPSSNPKIQKSIYPLPQE